MDQRFGVVQKVQWDSQNNIQSEIWYQENTYFCFIHFDQSTINFWPRRNSTDVPKLVWVFSKEASFHLQQKFSILNTVIICITDQKRVVSIGTINGNEPHNAQGPLHGSIFIWYTQETLKRCVRSLIHKSWQMLPSWNILISHFWPNIQLILLIFAT